jgi:hypothetical protein
MANLSGKRTLFFLLTLESRPELIDRNDGTDGANKPMVNHPVCETLRSTQEGTFMDNVPYFVYSTNIG